MLTAGRLAISDLLSPAFRSVVLKSLGLTLLLLLVLWLAVELLLAWAIDIKAHPWLDTLISVLTGIGLLVGLAFLVAPVASLFAGLFSDQIARAIEAVHYPLDPPGRDVPILDSLRETIAFTVVVIVVNLIALALLLVPGINAIAFLLGNAYLLGRQFFVSVVRRYLSAEETRKTGRSHHIKIFLAGLVIAVLAVIPILNLLTPLFATSFMLHFYKRSIRPVPTEWLDFAP
jgi:CysZ protein